MNAPISLSGEIAAASLVSGTLELTIDVGQKYPAVFHIPVVSRNADVERAGQSMLSRICHAVGVMQLKDVDQLVGHEVAVKVIQPLVADGLVRPLVVVGVSP